MQNLVFLWLLSIVEFLPVIAQGSEKQAKYRDCARVRSSFLPLQLSVRTLRKLCLYIGPMHTYSGECFHFECSECLLAGTNTGN